MNDMNKCWREAVDRRGYMYKSAGSVYVSEEFTYGFPVAIRLEYPGIDVMLSFHD